MVRALLAQRADIHFLVRSLRAGELDVGANEDHEQGIKALTMPKDCSSGSGVDERKYAKFGVCLLQHLHGKAQSSFWFSCNQCFWFNCNQW